MYNLFVSGDEDAWDGEPWIIETGRCVREYTIDDLTARFGDFSAEQVNELRRFPCIFASRPSMLRVRNSALFTMWGFGKATTK